MKYNYKIQKFGVWCGLLFAVFFGGGFAVVPGFILVPPLPPTLTPSELMAIVDENRFSLKVGMTMCFNFTLFFMPWSGAIAGQIERMEGDSKMLSGLVRNFSTIVAIGGCLPAVIYLAILYRPDIDPSIAFMLNDLFWIFFIGWVSPLFFLAGTIGIAVLSANPEENVFPRWFGFFCFFEITLFMGGLVFIFFYEGPFAWNGLFPFWIPLITLGPWMIVASVLTYKNLNKQEAEAYR